MSYGQDTQFTQFYSAPLYLAPSFAGGTKGTRAVLNYRTQWPNISHGYRTFSFSIDHYFPQHKSGVGLLVYRDVAGISRLSNLNIGLQYSYNIRLSREWYVRPALQFMRHKRSVDVTNLLFGDQISLYGISPSSVEARNIQEKISYFDFATSIITFSEKYWFGIVIDHLTKPDQSLMNNISIVPIKTSFLGGTKFALNDATGKWNKETATITYLYKSQGRYDQLDIGAYWSKLPLSIGLWYRGIPMFKRYAPGYINNDAISIIVGYVNDELRIGYSYDFTISRLSSNTGGAHELAIIFEFNQDQKPKRKRSFIIPCPKF